MHLVGYLYEDYHDARSLEHKVHLYVCYYRYFELYAIIPLSYAATRINELTFVTDSFVRLQLNMFHMQSGVKEFYVENHVLKVAEFELRNLA